MKGSIEGFRLSNTYPNENLFFKTSRVTTTAKSSTSNTLRRPLKKTNFASALAMVSEDMINWLGYLRTYAAAAIEHDINLALENWRK